VGASVIMGGMNDTSWKTHTNTIKAHCI
jgi:hypothetical protein